MVATRQSTDAFLYMFELVSKARRTECVWALLEQQYAETYLEHCWAGSTEDATARMICFAEIRLFRACTITTAPSWSSSLINLETRSLLHPYPYSIRLKLNLQTKVYHKHEPERVSLASLHEMASVLHFSKWHRTLAAVPKI